MNRLFDAFFGAAGSAPWRIGLGVGFRRWTSFETGEEPEERQPTKLQIGS